MFDKYVQKIAQWAGSMGAIYFSLGSLIIFLITGWIMEFSDRSQLFFSNFMSAVSYVMLFIIQRTQNHDTEALQIKVSELVRTSEKTDNRFIDIEKMNDEELSVLRKELNDICEKP